MSNRALMRVGSVAAAVLMLGGISAVTMAASADSGPGQDHHSGKTVDDGGGNGDAAGPRAVTCHSGDILTGFYGTVTVPSGNYCELLQATVVGNVIAQRGAVQLGIDNSQISGYVSATGVTDNGWICGSRIRGKVQVADSASNPDVTTSPGMWDIGFSDPNYCGDTAFDPVPGNAIEGSLIFSNNSSGGEIGNNDIENDLTCVGNTPPPVGGNNAVDKSASGQCAAMGGAADTDTTSPGDND